MKLRTVLGLLLLMGSGMLEAQTVQPVIMEYKGRAEGKFAVTNDTLAPMAVVLEAKSFSITAEGKGMFRPLDAGIHVELSGTSVRLQPKQSYYFFYKATADQLPAWFTVYATFSSVSHGPGLDVRMMLPHTVYLYQPQTIAKEDVRISEGVFSTKTGKLTMTVENVGGSLTRVQEVHAIGGRENTDVSGFPLLPGGTRKIEMPWSFAEPPSEVTFHFPRFDMRRPVLVRDE